MRKALARWTNRHALTTGMICTAFTLAFVWGVIEQAGKQAWGYAAEYAAWAIMTGLTAAAYLVVARRQRRSARE